MTTLTLPTNRIAQYWSLTKPRVTQLAVFCAVIGMFLSLLFLSNFLLKLMFDCSDLPVMPLLFLCLEYPEPLIHCVLVCFILARLLLAPLLLRLRNRLVLQPT